MEADTLQNERIEELLTRPPPPRRERPAVPLRSGPGSVEDALAALRWRLTRPAAARLRLHRALYAHARAALRLQAVESEQAIDVGNWLLALGAPEIGLVPVLDAYLRDGEEADVRAALEQAEDALTSALHQTWAARAIESVRQVAAALVLTGSANQARVDALGVALGHALRAAATDAERSAVDTEVVALFQVADALRRTGPIVMTAEEDRPSDGFVPMELEPAAVERSRGLLDTPEWAIEIGLRQIGLYNESRGRRDLKKLQGTPAGEAALWELRHRDSRHPVRVLWRYRPGGPRAIAIMVKDDEDDQRRVLARVADW